MLSPHYNKRAFLSVLGRGAMAAMLASAVPFACRPRMEKSEAAEESASAPPRKNWIWIHPGAQRDDDEWRRVFERLKTAGIDAILPEVYNGKEALFEHPNPLIPTKAKVLERIIPLAREAGLEIHAWMWTMLCPNERVAAAHPDWYAVNGLGRSARSHPAYVPYYQFLSPCHPEARAFVRDNVETLARVEGLDGVHLDYTRLPDVILAKGLWPKYGIVQDREYPQYDYCYSEHCRARFKKETGIDPSRDLEDPSADAAWRQFRQDVITELVNEALAPAAREYGKTVSAAVFPNWESVRQEWHRWQLDAFMPMLYHSFYEAGIDWVKEQMLAARRRLRQAGNDAPVYAGLFLPALKAEEMAPAVVHAYQGGADGISWFSYKALDETRWQALERHKAWKAD
jgi:uncharacterized lipoprotein YddW (UPF0748 family)